MGTNFSQWLSKGRKSMQTLESLPVLLHSYAVVGVDNPFAQSSGDHVPPT